MNDLDFTGWNNADWNGVFTHHHTDDVLVNWKDQQPTHGVQEHIDAMKATSNLPVARRRRSRPTRSPSDPASGPA